MEIQQRIKERISEIDRERAKLSELLDIYGEPEKSDIAKSDQYRHIIRELVRQPKAWHITDMEAEFERRGVQFDKGTAHQCLNGLRETGEVIAIRLNHSNQKYYYMGDQAKNGENVKPDYLPMPKQYINKIEMM